MTTERIDPLAVMRALHSNALSCRLSPNQCDSFYVSIEAVAELVEADREYDAADGKWGGEWYEADSYGVPGSNFLRCLDCDNESGAGLLNEGVTHEDDCLVGALERATARRAAALAAFGRQV